MYRKVRYITLRVIFQAEEDGELPLNLGSTIRGILGYSMRDLVCINEDVHCR